MSQEKFQEAMVMEEVSPFYSPRFIHIKCLVRINRGSGTGTYSNNLMNMKTKLDNTTDVGVVSENLPHPHQ